MQAISADNKNLVPLLLFFNAKNPRSAGISISFISPNQRGWVKSPVPITFIPFTFAHWSSEAKFIRSDVARE